MLCPNTARDLLGHLLRGVDMPTTDQKSSPLPVRLSTSLSLREISAAGAEGGGARDGESGHRSLRDRGGGGGGSGGKIRDRGGVTSGAAGAARRKTESTKTTAAQESRRDPTAQLCSEGAGEECRAEIADQEESAKKAPSGVERTWRNRRQRRRLILQGMLTLNGNPLNE